jgi:hypothetical protein
LGERHLKNLGRSLSISLDSDRLSMLDYGHAGNHARHQGATTMHTEKFSGTIKTAYGKPVNPPINFEGEYDAFGPDKKVYTDADWEAALNEIKSFQGGKELPSTKDIVEFVNGKRQANQRQQMLTAKLDEAGIVKPSLETDAQFRYDQMVKILKLSGMSDAEAAQTASTALNFSPAGV